MLNSGKGRSPSYTLEMLPIIAGVWNLAMGFTVVAHRLACRQERVAGSPWLRSLAWRWSTARSMLGRRSRCRGRGYSLQGRRGSVAPRGGVEGLGRGCGT
jgi:hypothetical protein